MSVVEFMKSDMRKVKLNLKFLNTIFNCILLFICDPAQYFIVHKSAIYLIDSTERVSMISSEDKRVTTTDSRPMARCTGIRGGRPLHSRSERSQDHDQDQDEIYTNL